MKNDRIDIKTYVTKGENNEGTNQEKHKFTNLPEIHTYIYILFFGFNIFIEKMTWKISLVHLRGPRLPFAHSKSAGQTVGAETAVTGTDSSPSPASGACFADTYNCQHFSPWPCHIVLTKLCTVRKFTDPRQAEVVGLFPSVTGDHFRLCSDPAKGPRGQQCQPAEPGQGNGHGTT